MSNKRVKAVLDHFHNFRHTLEGGVNIINGNNKAGIKNFSRTIDHAVGELESLRIDLRDQHLDDATRSASKAKHCFADLSRMLRDCSNGAVISAEQAKTSLFNGFKALDEVANVVHKKDDQHTKHSQAPRVKYKPKEKEEKAAQER